MSRARVPSKKLSTAILQRKCTCAGSGECEECKKEKTLQRKAMDGAGPGFAPPIVHRALGSTGQPLDASSRAIFEPRLGHDFSNVRIHTDDLAEQSAAAVSAHAYTVGHDIVFGRSQYRPGSTAGRELLGHELTHVVQQRSVSNPKGGALRIDSPSSPFEAAADRASKGHVPSQAATGSPLVQRSVYQEIKEGAYQGIIMGVRKANDWYLNALRAAVGRLPPQYREAGGMFVTLSDWVNGALIAIMMGVLGMAVGLGEGVVDLLEGLAHLIIGSFKLTFDIITGFFDNFEAAGQDLKAIAQALLGLPQAIKALVSDWLDRFQKASSERQSAMIGELTGQILALIATWAATAGRAGTAAKAAAGADTATGAAATVTDAGSAARPALRVIEGGGQAAPRATGATARLATEGNTALKVAPAIEEAPRFVPQIVPPPVAAPAAAPTALKGASAATKAATTTTIVAAKATQLAKKKPKREDPCDSLPILWPKLLPNMPGPRTLKRTGPEERESEGIERGKAQKAFQGCINEARNRNPPLEPVDHCSKFGVWFDPNLTAGAPADAHHMHPMYLGGEDAVYNLGALDPLTHQRGHAQLDNQSSMLNTPEWQACQPISPQLKNHPVNQEYHIVGRK